MSCQILFHLLKTLPLAAPFLKQLANYIHAFIYLLNCFVLVRVTGLLDPNPATDVQRQDTLWTGHQQGVNHTPTHTHFHT